MPRGSHHLAAALRSSHALTAVLRLRCTRCLYRDVQRGALEALSFRTSQTLPPNSECDEISISNLNLRCIRYRFAGHSTENPSRRVAMDSAGPTIRGPVLSKGI